MSKQRSRQSAQPTSPAAAALIPLYQEWLPLHLLRQLFQQTGHRFYQRVWPPVLVVWGFIFQRLNPDHTCDAAWLYLSSEAIRARFGLAPRSGGDRSESNSAYCQARKRLPWPVVQGVLATTARAVQATFGETGRWHGYRVNLFDGSTLRLPASPELTKHYGVATNQHGPSHWPILRFVAGFDLFSGVANDVTEGAYQTGEHPLAVQLIRRLGAGFLHVGDRNFGVYRLVQTITAVQSDAVLRLKITPAQRLAEQPLCAGLDRDVSWSPSAFDTCEPDLPTGPIAGRLLYVRLTRNGFRPIDLYLFTTLTDRQAFPCQDLVALYGTRWNVELDLRHVKTTLQMEQLDGQSVDIVRKELSLGLAAYNLVRGLMGVAALRTQRLPLELSLAQCWRRTFEACRSLVPWAAPAEVAQAVECLLRRLGHCVLPKRQRARFEPRAVWGRPRVYPTIKGSREQARQEWMQLLRNKES